MPILCLLSSVLPVEVRGGAHDHERREGAVATGDERADVETGEPSALRASQDHRRAGIRADQELGISGFGLRGKEKVAGEFSLVCVAHNLKKIMLAALRGEVCPEFGKRAAWA